MFTAVNLKALSEFRFAQNMADDRLSEIDHDLRESKKHVFYRMSNTGK